MINGFLIALILLIATTKDVVVYIREKLAKKKGEALEQDASQQISGEVSGTAEDRQSSQTAKKQQPTEGLLHNESFSLTELDEESKGNETCRNVDEFSPIKIEEVKMGKLELCFDETNDLFYIGAKIYSSNVGILNNKKRKVCCFTFNNAYDMFLDTKCKWQ